MIFKHLEFTFWKFLLEPLASFMDYIDVLASCTPDSLVKEKEIKPNCGKVGVEWQE